MFSSSSSKVAPWLKTPGTSRRRPTYQPASSFVYSRVQVQVIIGLFSIPQRSRGQLEQYAHAAYSGYLSMIACWTSKSMMEKITDSNTLRQVHRKENGDSRLNDDGVSVTSNRGRGRQARKSPSPFLQ